MSDLEETLALHIRAAVLPEPEREYAFYKPRRWRFDFAWPELELAVEVEGGKWTRGRHTRPEGFERDCEKYNTAALAGWKVLRFTGDMVESGAAIDTITDAIRRLREAKRWREYVSAKLTNQNQM